MVGMNGSQSNYENFNKSQWIDQSLPTGAKMDKREDDPIVPTSVKVALVFGIVIAAVLITAACLISHGTIPLSTSGWEFKVITGSAIAVGSCQVLILPFLAKHYFNI